LKNKLKEFEEWLIGPKRVDQLERWSKSVSFPGFSGVPLYNIATFIY